jgi:hypothetical protein
VSVTTLSLSFGRNNLASRSNTLGTPSSGMLSKSTAIWRRTIVPFATNRTARRWLSPRLGEMFKAWSSKLSWKLRLENCLAQPTVSLRTPLRRAVESDSDPGWRKTGLASDDGFIVLQPSWSSSWINQDLQNNVARDVRNSWLNTGKAYQRLSVTKRLREEAHLIRQAVV